MLKIRDFARLGEVSMATLRYYDEIGLLKPIRVDPETGYRFYTVDQLPHLHRILALKELGLGLAQIVQILDEGVSSEALQGMLRLRQADLQQRIRGEQEQLARIEARLPEAAPFIPFASAMGMKGAFLFLGLGEGGNVHQEQMFLTVDSLLL